MAQTIRIVGGPENGKRIKWFGNRVRIQRDEYVLNRVFYGDGTTRDYYVVVTACTRWHLDVPTGTTVQRIEALG